MNGTCDQVSPTRNYNKHCVTCYTHACRVCSLLYYIVWSGKRVWVGVPLITLLDNRKLLPPRFSWRIITLGRRIKLIIRKYKCMRLHTSLGCTVLKQKKNTITCIELQVKAINGVERWLANSCYRHAVHY